MVEVAVVEDGITVEAGLINSFCSLFSMELFPSVGRA
jgi:hypothetical protein